MHAYAPTMKPYKGMRMEGAVAKWYAALTRKSPGRFKELAQQIANQVPSGGSVLEVAPGPGYFAIELAKLGEFKITGLDISKTFVENARANAAKAGVQVDFQHGNASNMPFPDESFDFLVCCAAFKNFAQPQRALEEMYRALKPGGKALIVDLRKDAPMASINQAIKEMKVGAINGLITSWTFRFMLLKRAYTRAGFEELISTTKFKDVQIRENLMGLEILLSKRNPASGLIYY